MTNPNEMPKFGLSQEELDGLFARMGQELVTAAEARQQAAAWPSLIERALGWLWRRSTEHEKAMAAVELRIAALEASLGTSKG